MSFLTSADFACAEKYWSPNYIQHSSHIEPGRDGLFNLVKSLPTGSKWEHGIMMAEGDYMMIHSRYSNPDGSAIVVVDIMRIKDGVFVEHWDAIRSRSNQGGIEEQASHVWKQLPAVGMFFGRRTVHSPGWPFRNDRLAPLSAF